MRGLEFLEARGLDEFGDGNAGDGGVARERHHGVAVTAEHERGDVLDGDVELLGDERAEARGVEHAGHADDALAWEAGLLERGLRHGVERIGDDDEDGVWRRPNSLRDHFGHDLEVGVEEVIAAHARLAGDAGGDDDDVRVRGVGVVVGAGNLAVALLDGHGFKKVEPLALGHAFDDVDENDIGKFLGCDPVGGGCANVASAYDCDFFAHVSRSFRVVFRDVFHDICRER